MLLLNAIIIYIYICIYIFHQHFTVNNSFIILFLDQVLFHKMIYHFDVVYQVNAHFEGTLDFKTIITYSYVIMGK